MSFSTSLGLNNLGVEDLRTSTVVSRELYIDIDKNLCFTGSMGEEKKVRDYQNDKEKAVLSLVNKYPLYSVDKLAEELPNISRRSIQRILEKNNLSTAEKRLAFAKGKGLALRPWLEKIKALAGEARVFKLGNLKMEMNWRLARVPVVLGGVALVAWQVVGFVSAKPPEISLDQPEPNFANKGERLFVAGRVSPATSRVTVGDIEVSLNGNGTFTAVVSIPLGESTLEVKAVGRGKESRLVRLVNREPTQEEIQDKEDNEAEKKRAANDRAAQVERRVNDLLAAKNAAAGERDFLRILNNHIEEDEGFFSVAGEVVNLGEEEVSWVTIAAQFLDQQGGVLDTKYGFATDFGQVLKPGEKSSFETQTTKKEFDQYSLELSWERGTVAGEATESAKEATASGEKEEMPETDEEVDF